MTTPWSGDGVPPAATRTRSPVAAPLAGRVVVVTRPPGAAEGALVRALASRGARVLSAPAIEIEPPEDPEPLRRACLRLAEGGFEWLVLTSAAGADSVLSVLGRQGVGAGGVRAQVAVVGEGTASALRRHGIEPSLVPPRFTTEALVAAMPSGSGAVLVARADIAPEGLEDGLAAKGWAPERVDAYRTVEAGGLPGEVQAALAGDGVDALTFTSASTVRGFRAAAGAVLAAALARPARPRVICIGPVTAAEAEARGLPVDGIASPHTIEGLVAAVERVLAAAPEESEESR